EHLDLVARAELSLADDAQVSAGTVRLAEALDHREIPEAHAELRARDPRLGDLEHGAADPPALADHRARDVEPLRGQVLAEHPGRDLAVELLGPPLLVLAGVRVHGFVRAAMDAPVGLIVAGDVDALDTNPALDRRLADRA